MFIPKARKRDRREFMQTALATTGLAAAANLLSPVRAAAQSQEKNARLDRLLDLAKMKPQGEWYEASVPDTLDLAKHAGLSINVLTRNVEPTKAYSVYQGFQLTKEPTLRGVTWNITGKNIRALPWLRAMTGSTQNLETEREMMRAMAQEINDDGQIYAPVDGDGVPKGTSNPVVNALVLLAMENWYQRDQNPAWKELIAKVSEGLQKVTLKAEDRAFYPLECGYRADGTWHYERRAGKQLLPYTPPDEPTSDQQGVEGAVKVKHARQVAALVKDYQLNASRSAVDVAWQLTRFMLKPGMWPDTSTQGYPSHEHGIFEGHFHANTHVSIMMLDLAIATNHEWLKQWVRESYDHGRRNGVTRMGWFPAWTMPVADPKAAWVAGRRPQDHHNRTEGCGVSDMLLLAVKLTDAGLGEYWEDVDHIVRNELVEAQFSDLELIRRAAGADKSHDPLLERFVGGFGSAAPTHNRPGIHGCCTANCAIGLYYAWHGITRFDQGIATVNLFLNRASSWMDVDSYLPFEGKVVLRNKQAKTAHVRIPAWVDTAKLKTFVNGRQATPARAGSYAIFENLKKSDEIRFEFPVPETVDKYTISGKQYTMSFRGSTMVSITPHDEPPNSYSMFLRDRLKATKAPMTTAKRFAVRRVLPLQ